MEGILKILNFKRFLKKMFLSSYENKIDKKGRVSVPATFRSHLGSLGYNGFVSYPSFNHPALEACSQDRIEKLSNTIDSLNPFEEKEIFLLHQFYQKVKIYNLIQKVEYRYHQNYLITLKLKIMFCLWVLEKLFKFGIQKFRKIQSSS